MDGEREEYGPRDSAGAEQRNMQVEASQSVSRIGHRSCASRACCFEAGYKAASYVVLSEGTTPNLSLCR